jgi:hypothetical protein
MGDRKYMLMTLLNTCCFIFSVTAGCFAVPQSDGTENQRGMKTDDSTCGGGRNPRCLTYEFIPGTEIRYLFSMDVHSLTRTEKAGDLLPDTQEMKQHLKTLIGRTVEKKYQDGAALVFYRFHTGTFRIVVDGKTAFDSEDDSFDSSMNPLAELKQQPLKIFVSPQGTIQLNHRDESLELSSQEEHILPVFRFLFPPFPESGEGEKTIPPNWADRVKIPLPLDLASKDSVVCDVAWNVPESSTKDVYALKGNIRLYGERERRESEHETVLPSPEVSGSGSVDLRFDSRKGIVLNGDMNFTLTIVTHLNYTGLDGDQRSAPSRMSIEVSVSLKHQES